LQYNLFLKGLFLALLFSSHLYSKNFSKQIYLLSQNNYWRTLGHYKNNISQIDSKEFFLHKNGKENSFLELNATISNLINPIFKDDNSTYCKYPARRVWIQKEIPSLNIKKQDCSILKKELSQIQNIEKVTLVFPTTHINSPASMFGHTLLRLDDKNKDLLNSYAINYAAFTNESNGFLYAWNGLTGGYKGKYSIIPYYKKINEYNNMENRDIWEYELNLNSSEIYKLKLHLFEIKHSWAKYYYFNRNCSYEILWLLQSAREELDLTSKFNYKTLPIDTIKEIKKNNLISKNNYRASSRKLLLLEYEKIKNKDIANKFYNTIDEKLIANLNINEKQLILNFSLDYIKYQKTQDTISKNVYLKRLLKFLKIRSKLGKNIPISITKGVDPTLVHNTNKIDIQFYKNNINVGLKPSFHSIDDLNNGFINGAYIDFFKLNININKNKKVSLDNISLFNIKSYSSQTDLFKPISWSIDLGNEKFKNNKNYYKLKLATGLTYSRNKFLNSFLLLGNIYSKEKTYFGYGLEYYLEYNFNKSKFVFDTKYEKYNFSNFNSYNIFYVHKLSINTNIKIGYLKNINKNIKYLSLSYNF